MAFRSFLMPDEEKSWILLGSTERIKNLRGASDDRLEVQTSGL